uniref:Carboxylic ester hydrolase n=1 Tax=Caenorhabditis tropicalis TaxID=1561998 RepID=A0A1I7TZ51_9PELO
MFLFLLILFLAPSALSLKVATTSYGKVRGITVWSDDNNHKYVFKSIPFAKPPLGDLRFAKPEDPDPWDHVLDASKYSFACMSNNTRSKYQKKTSEDCLYINVFTSERCFAKHCAVIVYFHGGAFKLDSAVMFDDTFILERYVSEDVIFVIPAYRLGAFGQLYLGPNGVLSENLLLFDNVKALQFVHNEIENFGGDPNRVTIMGHSAGGTLIDALGFSKMIDPDASFFQQMITLSGQGEYGFYDVAVNISYNLVERVGCMPENQNRSFANIGDIMNCMRKTDAIDILKVQTEMIDEDEINFKSIIRGAPFMELNGLISDLKKNVPKRNMICGSTQLEYKNDPYEFHAAGTFIDLENPHEVVEHYYESMKGKGITQKIIYTNCRIQENKWIDPLSSAIYISARTYCEAVALSSGNSYLFETWQKPFSSHLTDMQYFIGIHREKIHTPDMDILDSFYSKLLVNFTRTGIPSPDWEKLDPKRMNYLELKVDSELNEGPVMRENYHDELFKYWMGPVKEYDINVTKWVKLETVDVVK